MPFAASVTVPLEGLASSVAVSVVPVSTSVSLLSTLPLVPALSSDTVAASLTATGLSLTGVTVTVTVPVAAPPLPSLAV